MKKRKTSTSIHVQTCQRIEIGFFTIVTMQQTEFSRRFTLIGILFLLQHDHLLAQTNLCPTFSCNCTLNSGVLDIVCDTSASGTSLPTLTNSALHGTVSQLSVKPAIASNPGPLSRLPTNLCTVYPNVQVLDLSNNQITGLVNTSELACLSSALTSIDLSYNFITTVNRNFFQANTRLQRINLSNNEMTTMPYIDPDMFVNFPRTLVYMDFSSNVITAVDLWPLFVKTGTSMTIDMRNNAVAGFVNEVPIYVKQFEETPDPRIFYLQNNLITRLSDYVVEQYGACATLSDTSIAYFVVGISNLLLTNNPLVCECDSYFLISYIQDRITQFPDISAGTALINQAICTLPTNATNQYYVSFEFGVIGDCLGYTLNNTVDKFCSIYSNDTSVTLAPPTYWTSTTAQTTVDGGNGNGGGGSGSGGSSNSGGSSGTSSSSPAWYIILGIVLGAAIILAVATVLGYWFRDRLLPKACRSKLGIRGRNGVGDGIYHPMSYASDGSSPRGSQYDGHDASNQGTQTGLPIERSRAAGPAGAAPKRKAQPIGNDAGSGRGGGGRKLSASKAADMSTNTNNVVRGIPIGSSKPPKAAPTPSNPTDTSMSELSVKSIPVGASKRAKLLPQVKSGMYVDTNNTHLLNTSAGGLLSHQRQRRRSASWLRKQAQSNASPLPARPQSMIDQKTSFDHEGSFDQDLPSIPTVESLADRPAKPLRTLPLLNITVVPAWIGDEDAEVAKVTGEGEE